MMGGNTRDQIRHDQAMRHKQEMEQMLSAAKQYAQDKQREAREAQRKAAALRLRDKAAQQSQTPTRTATPSTVPTSTATATAHQAAIPQKKHKHKKRKQKNITEKHVKSSSLPVLSDSSRSTLSSAAKERRQIAKRHWKHALDTIRSNVRLDQTSVPLLGLTGTAYHLEKLDPKHRRGRDLIKEFNEWKESKTPDNFFTWLDKKEESTGKRIVRMVYRTSESQQNEILAKYKDDKLFINDKLCDTTAYKGKLSGFAAFVLSPDNKLFLTEHRGMNVAHASLQGGKRVASAGMVKVKQGKITELTNFSGHYHPRLRNLLYAVKNIPENCFISDAKIIYLHQRFPWLAKKLKDSKYKPLRWIGGWLSKKYKEIKLSRNAFIQFAEKELEKEGNKFIYKRDKKDNRYENTLYESYLAKAIIENDETWRPLILRINEWIYDKIKSNKTNAKMVAVLIKYLKKYTKIEINKTNFLEVSKHFLLKSRDLAPAVMFHGAFFEYVHPEMNEKSFEQLPAYKRVRSDDLFFGRNRGVAAITTFHRRRALCKSPFYRSNALGIMPDEETPSELLQYFKGQPGKHRPTKRLHKLGGERISYAAAQRNRESKIGTTTTFREEVIDRDVSLISGASGTTCRILAPLIDSIKFSPEQTKAYLMVIGSAITAAGHHSMYEVMILARNLGFPIEYNHRFYHNQFITKEFRKSKAYKNFLQSYSQIAEAHISPPSKSKVHGHETYVRVKKAIEAKSEMKTDLTAQKEKRPSRPVQSASKVSIGSSQRVFLWKPSQTNQKDIVDSGEIAVPKTKEF